MRMLQICNVGEICGGTAACAWTITRVFPDCQHIVVFLSAITEDTKAAFDYSTLVSTRYVSEKLLLEYRPDVIIMHNTSPDRIDQLALNSLPAISLQYHHSRGTRANADVAVACSKWLADQIPKRAAVLYQAVPRAPQPEYCPQRQLESEFIVGRLCSPQQKKWPHQLIDFYAALADQHRTVRWEFVGAPESLESELMQACRDKAVFHSPGPGARQLFWTWHALLYHHPTLTESFGRTVAEAMRAKCVPIVDARGGFLEQIDHQRTGFLCSEFKAFSEAISALSSVPTWFQISRNAAIYGDERFSLKRMRGEILSLLNESRCSEREVCGCNR